MPPIEVYFSPHGGCTEAIVKEIEAAKKTILVQAYQLHLPPRSPGRWSMPTAGASMSASFSTTRKAARSFPGRNAARRRRFPCWPTPLHNLAHNKVIILDDAVVITGSFNFTQQAENGNAENLLVIRDRENRPAVHGELAGARRAQPALVVGRDAAARIPSAGALIPTRWSISPSSPRTR